MAKVTRAIIVGGGIGGAATALSLARQGIKVMLLEKAHEIGEIGAGSSWGRMPFRHWIVWASATWRPAGGVYRSSRVDAVNGEEVVRIETGQAFRATLAARMR
ncbi:FAD-dependent oxidoreductase [Klebsiella pneumoniae]|uniref:FAD-dependent oxidoreductase n=1 Tax=Klebsiella pneumoniae TaxID=573 RepID=UPI00203B1FB8|nr:FAD-dependent oxidoreductase [Klebsiella pneumoniae]